MMRVDEEEEEEEEEAAKKLRERKVGFNFRRECILGC